MVRPLHISTVIFAVLITFFETALSQIDNPGSDKSMFRGVSGVTLGATMQHWTLKDSGTILQQSAPITVAVPLANRLLLSVTNSAATSRTVIDTGNGEVTTEVSDIADTRLSLSYVLPGEKLWITGGISIPTGRTRLSAEQLQLTSLISQTAFAYKVPTLGQGFSGNLALVYAGTITRRMVVGAGLSYYYKAPYEPVEVANTFKYDAGDEFSVNVGYDFITFSKTGRISIDITGTYFLEDKLSDNTATRKIFQSGPRVIGLAAYSLRTGEYNHQVLARVRYRMPNSVLTDSTTTKFDASTQIEGQYIVSFPVNEWLSGGATAEIRSYTADQITVGGVVKETGKASITSAGVDGTFLFSEIIVPTVSLRYAMGSMTLQDNVHDVNGIEATLSLRISF